VVGRLRRAVLRQPASGSGGIDLALPRRHLGRTDTVAAAIERTGAGRGPTRPRALAAA